MEKGGGEKREGEKINDGFLFLSFFVRAGNQEKVRKKEEMWKGRRKEGWLDRIICSFIISFCMCRVYF